MKKCERLLIEETILVLILVVLVALVCAGVLSRYLFNWSLSFTEELTRYLMIWLACLGVPACLARREMIHFQWPYRKSRWYAAVTWWSAMGMNIFFFVVLFYSSCKMIQLQWQYAVRTSVMGWPMVWVSLAFPVGALVFLIRLVMQWREINARD